MQDAGAVTPTRNKGNIRGLWVSMEARRFYAFRDRSWTHARGVKRFYLVRVERRLAAAILGVNAFSLRLGYPLKLTLFMKVRFELCEHTQHIEEGFPGHQLRAEVHRSLGSRVDQSR